MSRVCLICSMVCESLVLLRRHVQAVHPMAMFTPVLKRRFVSQATEAYCGGQTQVMEKITIPEVVAVFGKDDKDAYYSMEENDGHGIDDEHEEQLDLKTPPSTYVEVLDRLIVVDLTNDDEVDMFADDDFKKEPSILYNGNGIIDHEFIEVNMSFEEEGLEDAVFTQADNYAGDCYFDYEQAQKDVCDQIEAEKILSNPYSPVAKKDSPPLPVDELD